MSEAESDFEALLSYLKDTRGFDFTGYKRSSLTRRVDHRMAQVGVSGYADYLDYIQVNPDEFTALFNTILINVTGFFRDAEAWDYLRNELLAPMVAALPLDAPIRIWSAGCSSGEEAYTIAIVMAELLGIDVFRRRVKIYATDVDNDGLAHARQGTYTAHEVRGVPNRCSKRTSRSSTGSTSSARICADR